MTASSPSPGARLPAGHGWRVLLTAATFAIAGCHTIGPASMQRDRMDYGSAIADSWKEQTLLNITKLRYFDTPIFLDISSVVSSYSLQTELRLGARIFPNSRADTFRELGASGTYIDRPTISYTPVTGKKYIDALLRPIPPQAILAMVQAGHQADFIMRGTVRAINGVYNASASPGRARGEDPTFERVIQAFRRIQQEGALGMRIEKRGAEEVTLVFFDRKASERADREIRYLHDVLGLDLETKEFLLTFGSIQRGKGEIAVLSRSVLEIYIEFSAGVEVPRQHVHENRARAAPQLPDERTPGVQPLAHIRSGTEPPSDAYAAVRYRDHWFWIDDRDVYSKRAFMFLMMFSSIAETGVAPQAPIITIPAN
jgi:hypothetical protein